MAVKKKKLDELMYKGKPIIRRGDKMYYGFIDDDYIIEINVKETEKIDDIDVSTNVSVQLITNKTKLQGNERMVKSSKKPGLYAALDLGAVWLDDVLETE